VPDALTGAGTAVGTLITVAPAAGPIGHLLRTAIDAEQVGATRLHLPVDQPDLPLAVSALREQTTLVITCDELVPGVDVVKSDFVDVVIQDGSDLPGLVAEVARLVAANPGGVAISGRGRAALPALLASLAAGGHIWVEAPEHDDKGPGPAVRSSTVKDHAALVARASGLARIAGRPPMDRTSTGRLLGLR
jgi:hypothetical protein